jgi:hypothetical protein
LIALSSKGLLFVVSVNRMIKQFGSSPLGSRMILRDKHMKKSFLKPDSSGDDEIIVEVTQEQYQAGLERRLAPDEILAPGRHKFIRGGFRKRNPNFDPAKAEVRYTVPLSLPPAGYDFFQQRAEQNGAVSGAGVMENILIDWMQKEKSAETPVVSAEQEALLEDPRFIQAVAEQVRKSLSKKKSAASSRASAGKSRRRVARPTR